MLPVALQHGGAGLRLGHDIGFPVSRLYDTPFPWNGGIEHLIIDTPGAPVDPAAEVRAALHSD